MARAHIAYERSTGRVLVVHHGGDDPELARRHAMEQGKLSEDQVAVIALPVDEVDAMRLHRVDTDREMLIEAQPDEGGVSFSFGGTRAPS